MKKILILVVWLAGLSFLFMSPSHGAESHHSFIKEATASISRCLEGRGDVRLVVTGLRTLEGDLNGLTVWLSECLTSELAKNQRLHVIASLSAIKDLSDLARRLLMDDEAANRGFQSKVGSVKEKTLTKDYGSPTSPAVTESVSLNPEDGLVMELTYDHR